MRTHYYFLLPGFFVTLVGMKPLSERDENLSLKPRNLLDLTTVGMKPLSERDENLPPGPCYYFLLPGCRNEATL